MKGCVTLLFLGVLLICGCMTQRYSGRYGDGTVCVGAGQVKVFRKFYLRKIEGDGASVSSASMSNKYPNLFRKSQQPHDIPVDLYVKKGKLETSGEWSIIFACLYSILPFWTSVEQEYTIELVVDGDDKLVPPSACSYAHDMKITIMSPLGLIPYGEKDGYQRNEFSSGFSNPDVAGVLEEVMGACIAQQLEKYAIDRLAIPDIDFALEEQEVGK